MIVNLASGAAVAGTTLLAAAVKARIKAVFLVVGGATIVNIKTANDVVCCPPIPLASNGDGVVLNENSTGWFETQDGLKINSDNAVSVGGIITIELID